MSIFCTALHCTQRLYCIYQLVGGKRAGGETDDPHSLASIAGDGQRSSSRIQYLLNIVTQLPTQLPKDAVYSRLFARLLAASRHHKIMMCRGGAARHRVIRSYRICGGPRRSPVIVHGPSQPRADLLLWPITSITHHEACPSASSDRARKKESNGNIFCVPLSRIISVLRCAALYCTVVL
jgi:hypothetical protein